MSVAQHATYSEARRFMPGDCGPEGLAAGIFAESDLQTEADAPQVALAKAACQSCLQLSNCREQLFGITETLFARDIDIAVVGGEAVMDEEDTVRYMTKRERIALEPHYTFDLSKPLLADDETAIVTLRQMACAKPRLLNGGVPKVAYWATDEVLRDQSVLVFANSLDLTSDEIDQVLLQLSRAMVAHAKQSEDVTSDGAYRRRPYEKQVDIRRLRALAPHYLYDAAKVKDMGFGRLDIVVHHGAEYWRRLLDAYDSSQCITPEAVIRYCEKYPSEPTRGIETQINMTVLKREGRYNNPYIIPAAIRRAEVARLEEELAEEHPYITHPMIQDAFNRSSSVPVARAKVERLKDPEIKSVVEEFRGVIIEPAIVYAVMHSENPRQWIADYLERVDDLTERIAVAGGQIAPSRIRTYALEPYTAESSGEQAILDINTEALRQSLAERCRAVRVKMHVPVWALGKIVKYYPAEEQWDLAVNLNELLENDILRLGYMSCALETEAAEVPGFLEHVVGKKGAYLSFSAKALAEYDAVSRAAIIRRSNLDQIIYGRMLPAQPAPADLQLPIWLSREDMSVLRSYIASGAKAERILRGEEEVPSGILTYMGLPHDRTAKTRVLSAIRVTALKARRAREAMGSISARAVRIYGA